jgi:tryptophan-rich sensory protein
MDWLISTAPTWATLAGFLAASFGAAATGAIFQPGAWYRTLAKPSWTPPDWLFPIAWTVLYIAMSVAAWWVALSPSVWAMPALAAWSWQIVMNALWSPVFFGLRRIGAAMVVILFLWLAVATTTFAFWHVERVAGLLMLPYLAWASYAGALNFAIWRMNPGGARAVAA